MTHPTIDLSHYLSGTTRLAPESKPYRMTTGFRLAAFLTTGLLAVCSIPGLAQTGNRGVPPVVVSSVSPLVVPSLINPTDLALDACGNIYTLDLGNNFTTGATITEVPENGAAASVVETLFPYNPGHLGQDATRSNLITGVAFGSGADLTPLVHCVPNTSAQVKVGGGDGPLFYFYNPDYLAGDFSGNTYISTNQTCCVAGSFNLIREPVANGNGGSVLISDSPAEIQSIAVDKNQNVYFISGGAVYELAFSNGTNSTTPLAFGTAYSNPTGVSVDVRGNLYIADEGAAVLYEIPNEAQHKGGTALNPSDQFIIASGVSSAVPVAVNGRGDIYFTQPNATAIDKLTQGGANFGKVPVGQTATATLNFQFNASTTIEAVLLPEGVFATEPVTSGSTPCTRGAKYGPNASENHCSIVVSFTPKAMGKQLNAVVLIDQATREPIVVAYLEGTGR